MINYFYDCYTILNKVYSEKSYVKQAINNTYIEEKNRALIVKTCYGVLDKDIELSYYLSCLTNRTPKLAIRTILKIAMYAIKYLNKKQYAVAQNAVELTKKLGKAGASGFVNAFIRKFVKYEFIFPKDEIEYLSVKYSYPLFAVKELVNYYGYSRTEKIISATNEQTILSFYEYDGEDYLKNKACEYFPTVFDGVYNVKNFIRNEDYDKGYYTYQALGSVAICDIVEPCEKLLDCCAAPGGKSVRLSYKCNEVVSWDIHSHRVDLIKDYSFRMRRKNIFACVQDAKNYIKDYDYFFDAVLCDVPCSGLGVVNDNPDIKINRSFDSIKNLNLEQIAILNTVSKYVKLGGHLYYSTCSVLPSENINIINTFMSGTTDFKICEINSKLPHENVLGTNVFLPDVSGGLGFYVAKLKRVK